MTNWYRKTSEGNLDPAARILGIIILVSFVAVPMAFPGDGTRGGRKLSETENTGEKQKVNDEWKMENIEFRIDGSTSSLVIGDSISDIRF